jgi:hypothetical protein
VPQQTALAQAQKRNPLPPRCRFEPTSWQVVKGRILAEAAHLSEACEQFAYEPSYTQWSSQQVRCCAVPFLHTGFRFRD